MTELERHLMIERYLVEHRTSRSKLARTIGCDRSWITLVLKHGARPSRQLRDALLAQGVPEELLAPARPDRSAQMERPDRPAGSIGDDKPEDAAWPDDVAPSRAANR